MWSAGVETDKNSVCRTPDWIERLCGLMRKKVMEDRNRWEGGNRDKRKNYREARRTGESTERGKDGLFLWNSLQRPQWERAGKSKLDVQDTVPRLLIL